MKISIIIPVYNEEKTISKTLKKVLEQDITGEVVVVDDGSKDNTAKILQRIASNNSRVKVLSHPRNLGKGAAVRTAVSKVTKNYLLIQDADLEYDPYEYQKLAAKASLTNVVFGSRLIRKNAHAYFRTYVGNVLMTQLCNLLYGTKLTDSYTCYKLIPSQIVKKMNLKSDGFELEAEITGKLAKANIPIIEVPISFKPRTYNQGKKIKALDAIKGAWAFFKIRFFKY